MLICLVNTARSIQWIWHFECVCVYCMISIWFWFWSRKSGSSVYLQRSFRLTIRRCALNYLTQIVVTRNKTTRLITAVLSVFFLWVFYVNSLDFFSSFFFCLKLKHKNRDHHTPRATLWVQIHAKGYRFDAHSRNNTFAQIALMLLLIIIFIFWKTLIVLSCHVVLGGYQVCQQADPCIRSQRLYCI